MTQVTNNPESNLSDILEVIKKHLRLILVTPVICGFAAYMFVTFAVTPQWEANAILQVGQFGQIEGKESPHQAIKLAEPVSSVIARMELPTFSAGFIGHTGFASTEQAAAKAIYDSSVKVVQVKGADFIEFKVRGYSPEMARSLAEASIHYLQSIHNEMMSPYLVRIHSQIQNIKADIESAKTEFEMLKKQLHAKHDWDSYNAVLAATVLQDKSRLLQELTEKHLIFTEQLSPNVTFTTKIIGDVNVSDAPVSPKKWFIVFMVALMSLLFSIFIVLAINSLSAGRTRS